MLKEKKELFQIPEGTFGTNLRFSFLYPHLEVSNPGRNVWDAEAGLMMASSFPCFKSRKERLGRINKINCIPVG